MDFVTDPFDVCRWSAATRRKGARIGFVPTMGALHEGHLDLVCRAKEECEHAVCSIFVNPLQFNNLHDLDRYPRTLAKDQELLERIGCDVLFAPDKEALFVDFKPRDHDLGGLDLYWEGPARPGHFQGVVNVVERLFHFVRPDHAYFGEKDRQQLEIIQYVSRTQNWPEKIVPCATKRAANGLALSSRNQLLTAEEREMASVLYRALLAARDIAYRASVEETREAALQVLALEPKVHLDHFGIVDPGTLEPLKEWGRSRNAVALIAARIGTVRLLDNATLNG